MHLCIICNQSYEKGWGICCSHACHNQRVNARDRSNDRHVIAKMAKIQDYNQNPKLCNKCQIPLPWDKKSNKFCSSSCSASVNNQKRDMKTIDKQRYSIIQTMINKGKKANYPFCSVVFKNCLTCSKVFRVTLYRSKYCNPTCRSHSNIKNYRIACKFKITKANHPQLFNKSLLESHGWYRAANHPEGYNPNGATWDHLFRIEDGFKLGIDPEVMSHPANAEMVSWKENFSRKTSQISYAELLRRIAQFENTYSTSNSGVPPTTL